QRDSSIGVVLAFGLGLAVLFIHLYPGRSGTSFSLLTGQIVGVSEHGLVQMAAIAAIICGALVFLYRPLVFSSADPDAADARGVPVRAINMIFAVLVGLAAAQAVQVVGALLVLSLLITPAAAAAAVTSSPVRAIGLTILFAEVAAVGGMLLSLAPGVPVSVFVTTISFVIYLACRAVAALRRCPPAPTPARQPVVESFRAAFRQVRAATSLPERLNVHWRGSRSATSRAGTRYAATAGVTAGPGAASRTPRAPRPPPPRR